MVSSTVWRSFRNATFKTFQLLVCKRKVEVDLDMYHLKLDDFLQVSVMKKGINRILSLTEFVCKL